MNSVCEDRNAKFKFFDVVDPSSFCLSLWNSGFAWKCQNYLIAVIQTDATNVQCTKENMQKMCTCVCGFFSSTSICIEQVQYSMFSFFFHWNSVLCTFFLVDLFSSSYPSPFSVFYFIICAIVILPNGISLSFGDGNQTRFKWNMYDHNNFRKFETQPIEQTKIYYNETWE